MTSREIVEIIFILIIGLSGIIPMVMGIIYYVRDNRRMDRERKDKSQKAASHQGT